MARKNFFQQKIEELGTDFVGVLRVQNKLIGSAKRIVADIAYGNFTMDDYIKYADYFYDPELMRVLIDYTLDRYKQYSYICECMNYAIAQMDMYKGQGLFNNISPIYSERDQITRTIRENIEYRDMFGVLYIHLTNTFNRRDITQMYPLTALINRNAVQRYF